MKALSTINTAANKTILTSVLVIAAAIGVSTYSNVQASNISLGGPRDCDANAVEYCGAGNVSQLQNKYHNGVSGHNTASSIHHIYSYFGISAGDIDSMNPVPGEVFSDGTVKVNGKVVATDAMTAGRKNMAGSTKVTYGGTTFYKRSPRVSFVSSPLAAYVVMRNGVFQFAILASCGNPVIAHPKPQPKPTPKPTHKPTPTPTKKPLPTHKACVRYACVIVAGVGPNTCSSNYNCQPHPTQKPYPTAKPTPTCTPTPYPTW